MPENKHINEAVWQSARNLLDCQVNLNNLCEAFDEVECDDGDLIIEFEGDENWSDAWEFDTGAPNSAGIYTDCITKDYHWVWEDDKKYGFFAVPLDVLTIMDNVRAFLAEPLHHLASGGSFEDVLGGIKDKLCIPPRQ